MGGCKERISYWGWPDEQQSWTFPGQDGMKYEVIVYSRSPLVRLELNGKIIGEKTIPDSAKLTAKFEVPYAPGELKAIAIEDGKEVEHVSLKTAGSASSIHLKADRISIKASRNDLSYVIAEITDDKGNIVPWGTIAIDFTITGAGELAGIGNANPSDMASFKQPRRNTFRGKCLVILRPKGGAGDIILEAKAAGLQPARIVINTK
jgi:beta-galactosidase